MNRKDKAKKAFDTAKANLDKLEKQRQAKLSKDNEQAEAVKNLVKNFQNNNKGDKTMKITKQLKSDLFFAKVLANITGEKHEDVVKELFVEKTMEYTTDHTSILNDVKSSDMIISFDERDADFDFVNELTKVDMQGKNSLEIPVDDEDFQLKHVAQGAESPDATWGESTITLSTSRGSLTFYMSKELQSKSRIDQLAYVQSKVSATVLRGVLELVFNGQGADSAQQDNAYAADGMGQKGPGLRAALSAASKTHNFSAVDIADAAALKTAMLAFYKAAGQLLVQKTSEFKLVVGLRLAQALSDAVRGKSVTGQNEFDLGKSIYPSNILGIPMRIMSSQYIKVPTTNGTGYDATGFISSTANNNDFEVCFLIRPKKVLWALDDLTVSSEFLNRRNAYEVVINCQVGVKVATDEIGLMGRNIGAAIS